MKQADIQDPRLAHILDYWLSKRRDGALPRRADMRPSELGASLRHLNMLDVLRALDGSLQFRHRLIGTHNIEWLGRDSTGRMVDADLYGADAPAIIASFSRIVQEARPYFRKTRLTWHDRRFVVNESVEMPLLDDDGVIAIVMRGAVFRPALEDDPHEPVFEPITV